MKYRPIERPSPSEKPRLARINRRTLSLPRLLWVELGSPFYMRFYDNGQKDLVLRPASGRERLIYKVERSSRCHRVRLHIPLHLQMQLLPGEYQTEQGEDQGERALIFRGALRHGL